MKLIGSAQHTHPAQPAELAMQPAPDFLIIGAQKCGTTWLHRWLAQHHQIRIPANKDQGFFSYQSTRSERAHASYSSQFALAQGEITAGEASAQYFWTATGSPWDVKPEGFEREIPGRVRETLGAEMRFLLCLRNPVERAVSGFLHHHRHGELAQTATLLEAGRHMGLIDMGFYARHLDNWLRAYPRDRFQVIIMEDDMARAPRATLRRAYRFLGVRDDLALPGVADPVYAGPPRVVDSNGIQACVKGGRPVTVDMDTLEELRAIYREDVAELGNLLGRDVQRIWGF